MTVFDAVKQLELNVFCDLIYGTARSFDTQEEFKAALNMEITEKGLQSINAVALRDGYQPLPPQGVDEMNIHGTLDCDCKKELNDLAKRVEFLEKRAVGYTFDDGSGHRGCPKGEPGIAGPSSMSHFEVKDECWTEEYAELQGLCITVLNFLYEHPELASKVEITKECIKSAL